MAKRKTMASSWNTDEVEELLQSVRVYGDVVKDPEYLSERFGVNSLESLSHELIPVAETASKSLASFARSKDEWKRSEIALGHFGQFFGGYLDLLLELKGYEPTTIKTSTGLSPQQTFWNQSVKRHVIQFWEDFAQVSSFLVSDPDPDAGLAPYVAMDEAARKFHDLEQALLERVDELEKAEKRLETIEQTARDAVGSIATGTYARRYTDEADKQQLLSVGWGIALIIFSVVLGWLIFKGSSQLEETETAVELGSRALRLALPAAGLVFAIRQFSAARHNMLVFKNKALALGTFEAFVEASPDDGTRSAVVLEVSKSVFSQQPTGFLRGNTGTPETTSTNIITEAFKAGGS